MFRFLSSNRQFHLGIATRNCFSGIATALRPIGFRIALRNRAEAQKFMIALLEVSDQELGRRRFLVTVEDHFHRSPDVLLEDWRNCRLRGDGRSLHSRSDGAIRVLCLRSLSGRLRRNLAYRRLS
jgi:hypothetical protein